MDLLTAQVAVTLATHPGDREALERFASTCSDEDAGVFARGKMIDLSWEADKYPTDDEIHEAFGEDATPVEINQAGVFALAMRWEPIERKVGDIMGS